MQSAESSPALGSASLWHTQFSGIGLRLECCLGLQMDFQAAQLGVVGEPAEHAGGFEKVALLLLEVLLQGKQRSWQRKSDITQASAPSFTNSNVLQVAGRLLLLKVLLQTSCSTVWKYTVGELQLELLQSTLG